MRCIHLYLSYFLRHSETWRELHIGPMAFLLLLLNYGGVV